jgi:hypothetical protein
MRRGSTIWGLGAAVLGAVVLSAVVLSIAVGCGGDDAGTGGQGGSTSTGGSGGGNVGGSGGSTGGGSPALTFLDDFNIDSGSMLDGIALGGLSGLWIDPDDGHSWAVCDDQSEFGPVRFYELDVTLDASAITVVPSSFTPFDTGATPAVEMDAEGIARTASGDLYISTEGDTTPVVAPALLRVDSDGVLIEELVVDAKFIPNGSSGVRRNQGFEALTLSPSGQVLFAASEATLLQDGPEASFDSGSRCRILRYDTASGSPTGEFVYVTEPIPPAVPGVLGSATNGLVELLAIGDDHLLALERSGVQVDGQFSNTIRVFEVRLSGADDVAGLDPLGPDVVAVQKTLLLDLDSILPQLDPAYPKLDNVEGMSFGPVLPDGRQSLVLMSDDNFNVSQRTAFFAFAIDWP